MIAAVKPRLTLESTLPAFRPYQDAVYNQSNSLTSNHIVQMPTGTGKGNIILKTAYDALSNLEPTLIVAPSLELVNNLGERLEEYMPQLFRLCSFVGTGFRGDVNSPFVIGVYKSLAGRLDRLPYFKKVLHEECHHSCSDSWSSIFRHFNRSQHIGYSATPTRLDGRPLGDNFTDLITSPSTRWFIDNGYLSEYDLRTIGSISLEKSFDDNLSQQQKLLDNRQLRADIVNNWMKEAYGKKTIVFATGKDHARHLKEEFNSRLEGTGYRFEILLDDMKKVEGINRKDVMKDFKEGKILGLINVSMVCEGVDVPDAEVCVLARFTQSLTFYLQMVGRVLRFKPGKLALIFDHAGNAMEHGAPCFEHDWCLEGLEAKTINDKYLCAACELPLISKAKVGKYGEVGIDLICPICQYRNHFMRLPELRLPRDPVPNVLDGELVKLTATPEEFKVFKIITSKRSHQDKVKAIQKARVPQEYKVKGLQILGVSDESIAIIL